jgi:hypothetical protein
MQTRMYGMDGHCVSKSMGKIHREMLVSLNGNVFIVDLIMNRRLSSLAHGTGGYRM